MRSTGRLDPFMTFAPLLLVTGLAVSAQDEAATPRDAFLRAVSWTRTFADATATAARDDKLIFAWVTRSPATDEVSRRIETEALNSPWWVASTRNHVAFLHFASGPDDALARRLGAPGLPYGAFLDPSGSLLVPCIPTDATALDRAKTRAHRILTLRTRTQDAPADATARAELLEALLGLGQPPSQDALAAEAAKAPPAPRGAATFPPWARRPPSVLMNSAGVMAERETEGATGPVTVDRFGTPAGRTDIARVPLTEVDAPYFLRTWQVRGNTAAANGDLATLREAISELARLNFVPFAAPARRIRSGLEQRLKTLEAARARSDQRKQAKKN